MKKSEALAALAETLDAFTDVLASTTEVVAALHQEVLEQEEAEEVDPLATFNSLGEE